jgi:tetratricopeptide (TPR) repeat protein
MRFNRVKNGYGNLAVLFLTAFLLYGNTIRNGYSLDDSYVTQNNPKVLKGFAGIPEILTSRYVDEEGNSFGYRPIAVTTFAIEHELWGRNPHLSHLMNTLLFALCSLLLFLLFRKIFHNTNRLFALAIVFLFAAHPIHTEVVASLKNRETLLSFLFSLVAVRMFLKWYDARKAWPAVAGVFAFALAFLSKQDAVTFVAVIPLALYYYSSQQIKIEISAGKIKSLFAGPYLYLSLAGTGAFLYYLSMYGLGGVVAALSYFSSLIFLIIHYRKQKNWTKHNAQRSKISYFFMAAGILFFLAAVYFFNSFLPLLSLLCFFIYFLRIPEKNTMRLIRIPSQWLYLLVPLLVLGIAGILFHKLPNLYLPAEEKVVYHFENPQFAQASGYSTWPLAFYTLFFYLQKLVWPHPLGFYYGYKMIPEVSWLMPEVIFSAIFHVGIFIWAAYKLPKKHILAFAILYYLATISVFTNIVIKIPGIVGERLAFFPSLGFCIALAWGIFKLLKIPVDAKQIPRKKIIQLSVVMLIILIPYSVKTITRNNDWKDYLTLYSADIGYLSQSAKANQTYASQLLKEAYNNEGQNPPPDVQQEYLELAVHHLHKTVEIDSTYKFAWNNLGYITYLYLGKPDEGIRYMKRAVQIDPAYEKVHYNLGYAYKQMKAFDKAIVHLKKAAEINPEESSYLSELADACFNLGDYNRAIEISMKAIRLNPESELPYINLGNSYWMKADTLQAIQNWEKAFEMNPSHLNLAHNLAGYYSSIGHPKAVYYRQKAAELKE